MSARLGTANFESTLITLQNTHAKALIEGNRNAFYLNYINLSIALVREVEGKIFTNPTGIIHLSLVPAGSGGAILINALAGAYIGYEIGVY
jgi:hypothetical protein